MTYKQITMKPGKSCAYPGGQFQECKTYTVGADGLTEQLAVSLVECGSADWVKSKPVAVVEPVKVEESEPVIEVEEPKPTGRRKKYKPSADKSE